MRSFRPRFAPFALALGLALSAGLTHTREATASVSFAVAYDDMVSDADAVVVVTPMDQRSMWEDNRIVTYTHLKVDEAVAGQAATGAEVWVRTLGGAVGKIGQQVDGEPVFVQGKSSLLFARASKPGVFSVVARAQGQFPVLVDPQTKRKSVMRNANCGLLLPRTQAVESKAGPVGPVAPQALTGARGMTAVVAVDALHGRMLEDVTRDIAAQWKRLHK
jgi:hypothetical protein